MQRSTLYRLLGLVLIVGGAAAALLVLPVNDYLKDFLRWTRGLKPEEGLLILALIWIPACIFAVPGGRHSSAGRAGRGPGNASWAAAEAFHGRPWLVSCVGPRSTCNDAEPAVARGEP